MKNRAVQIVVTLLLSALALYLALRGIDFQEVGRALAQVEWGWMFATLLLVLGTLAIRAQRWRLLLAKKLSFGDAFGLINIGYLVSGVLPLRAGDPARGAGACLRGPISLLAALSTVVVERVFDMLMIVLLLVATLPFVPGLQDYLAQGQANAFLSYQALLILSGVISLGIVAGFVAIAAFPGPIEKFARRVLDRLRVKNPDRWLKPFHSISEGLSALSSLSASLKLILWTIALWIVTALDFTTAMLACRAFIPQPTLLKGAVAMWASALGMVFPATGGIGSFHFAVREALYWGFAVPRDMGFSYALVIHAIPYVTGILLGSVVLLRWGISIKSLIGSRDSGKTNDGS